MKQGCGGRHGRTTALKLTAALVAHTRSSHPKLQHRPGRTYKVFSLSEELLEADGFWGKKVSFLQGVCLVYTSLLVDGIIHMHTPPALTSLSVL